MHTSHKTSKNHHLIVLVLAISSLLPACENQKSNHDSLLGLGLGISDATVVVSNLDSARLHYTEDLGFDIPKPEKYAKGIYQGSIGFSAFFPDMSALEFITLKDSTAKAKHSFIGSFLKKQEGVRLYDLSTSAAKNTLDWLNTRGFAIDSVQEGRGAAELPKGWDWDDGGPQWRQVSLNPKNPPAYLPGFMEYIGLPYQDYQKEKTSIYAMNRTYSNHPNGVVGMTALRIVVDNLKAARKEFKKMGLTELKDPKSPDVIRFQVSANQELQLITPQSPADSLSKFLTARGPGVYAMRFEVKKLKATRAFFSKKLPAQALRMGKSPERLIVLKEYAHGVQLEFVEEPKAQALLAQRYEIVEGKKLNPVAKKHASVLYQKYCALCHGKDREGYAADNAPSLKSHSLMSVTKIPAANYNFLRYTIAYGRQGTAMAAYAKDQGGPLEHLDIDLLITWLREKSGVKKPVELSTYPVPGDVALGKKLYNKTCATCHGVKGEGVSAPALGNPMFLATASDAFLRYAIAEGRDSTPMRAFKNELKKEEIDALTAYIRSRASGWNAPGAVVIKEPLPKDYILNPKNKAPKFTLREGKYVPAEQVLKALQDKSRMVILDARSKAGWHQSHIPGAVPVPYYEEPDSFIKDMPKDKTWIVVYCACPHAASEKVVSTLRRLGYKNTAIIDEGILVWTNRGYPVQYGQGDVAKK
jgi:mono/diheme cytochrome c family protein/rhodanese-related sulfurtransferase